MKPIDTMILLAYAGLPMSILIALFLRFIGVPVGYQCAVVVIGVLLSAMNGAMCWAARTGDERP